MDRRDSFRSLFAWFLMFASTAFVLLAIFGRKHLHKASVFN
jgi:hypothetical protein